MAETVIQHILSRLNEIGVDDIFGVAGDYAFPVNDAIVEHAALNWIGCCNELNAAYAADGYARMRGVAALCTTYGVGELAAMSGVAGAYAEHLAVFHLVGTPNLATQEARSLVHHTLGNGEFDLFHRMAEPIVCASAIMTPQNAVAETERLIAAALYHRRPVYMAIPSDVADMPVLGAAGPTQAATSDPTSLAAATDAVLAVLKDAGQACALPGVLLRRLGLTAAAEAFVAASGLPFATMFADKSVLGEDHRNYIGMYVGRLMDEPVRAFVESCDAVVMIGAMLTDGNTAGNTIRLDAATMVDIGHHRTTVGSVTYRNVEMADILAQLSERVTKRTEVPVISPETLGPIHGGGEDPITADTLYPRWAEFFRPDDVILTDTGTASLGLAFAQLPAGAEFHNQTLWASIGWATPAAFGAAVGAPDRRLILITGEGSHQMTAQEISQFGRHGLNPIIMVLNNSGYLSERMLCKDMTLAYNDIAAWNYAELPRALGCEGWFTARVSTCGALDDALKAAGQTDGAAYIEVVTAADEAPPMYRTLHAHVESFYNRR
ncbi:alpha-keto acid decarboxylase family protein [Mycolicibacterium brisbanense]|uniref:Alpha-keto-acid decarboxylase n=1 Tax=Mycolicibacterium brisbanense TaxID=146020 RepID=A0A124DZ96_9MYCO|nr:thiamine pyrophosphate-binding protein [Mycolicibacterium brisbanense]MCV7156805.1 alpha-keto acid decarboxylase family protein [Mycolicibacterium brisbanense]GAS86703.1 thiamine pyrophosphate protein TPP binding domain protein [Mycolicibacterium brisbanense]